MTKFEGSFRCLPQLLSVSNVYTCFYTFFLRGWGGGGGGGEGGGGEGYIFMEKSPGFEIGKFGNYAISYFKTNLDSREIIPQYMLLPKSQKLSKSLLYIFIDLRKAFDTVNHGILLKKLEHYGMRDNMLDWFQSYLSDRKQYVDINGKSSDFILDITCGVPQGSVLGPLLFLIYINDLPNISKILNFYLFADDTNIYYESSSLDKLERTVNRELNNLFLWLNASRLSLNIDSLFSIPTINQ